MNAQRAKQVLAVVAAIVVSIVLARLVWPYITLPFSNPLQIVGPLTAEGFSPANNVVRYIVFVMAPSLGWFASKGWRLHPEGFTEAEPARLPLGAAIALCCLVCVYAVARSFHEFALPLPDGPLDYFHDGETLSAGMTMLQTGKAWTGSFFVHGLFYDPLLSVLAWKLSRHITIGSVRLLDETLRHLLPLALASFLLVTAWVLRRRIGGLRALGFAVVSLATFALTDLRLQYLDLRDLYALCACAGVLTAIAVERYWLSPLAGFVAGLGLFNTIERGAYVIVCGVAALGLAAVASRERGRVVRCVLFVVGVALAVMAVGLRVGGHELAAFAENFAYWARNKDLMDAYVYPTPFTKTASIYTTPLLLNAASVLGLVVAYPAYVRRADWSRLAVHAFFVMLACVYFRGALGRSDTFHVIYTSTFAYLVFAWTIVHYLRGRALQALVALSAIVIGVYAGIQGGGALRPVEEVLSYVARGKALAVRTDDSFLSEEDSAAVAKLLDVLQAEPCSFVYPTQPALHYLLRRPSCTRFYLTWFATGLPHQEESIEALERNPPGRIIWTPSDAKGMDDFSAGVAYPLLDAYVQEHYALEGTFGRWQVAKRH